MQPGHDRVPLPLSLLLLRFAPYGGDAGGLAEGADVAAFDPFFEAFDVEFVVAFKGANAVAGFDGEDSYDAGRHGFVVRGVEVGVGEGSVYLEGRFCDGGGDFGPVTG